MRKLSADMDELIDTVRRDVLCMIEAKRKEMMADVEKAAIRFVVLYSSR